MPEYNHAEKTAIDSVEDHDRYVLHSKGEIRNQLLSLAKKPDIITAYFNGGKEFFLTAVLGVLKERNLLVLDIGPDDAVTSKAIKSNRLVCTTRSMGVPFKFTVEGLHSAKYQGRAAIATSMPETLFRKQRREFFRVQVPRINAPQCTLCPDKESAPITLQIVDISVGGLSLVAHEDIFKPELFSVYKNCLVQLPDFDEFHVDIEVRNKGGFFTGKNEAIPRIGVSFLNVPTQINLYLQRYIYHLQSLSAGH
jgi:flagellar brake protein